jgi:dihydroorotase (multifunctional complex type)
MKGSSKLPELELGIEDGIVATGSGLRPANVYIVGGQIAAVTPDRLPVENRYSARGLLVMPGMVDVHVHFMDPADLTREDFMTATAAAVRAGVTTVVEHSHGAPVRTPADLVEKAQYLAGRSRIDYALGAHAWPGSPGEAVEAWRAGAAFIKAFTCTTHGIPGHDRGQLRELFVASAQASATCLLHCEDEAMLMASEQLLRASGREDGGLIPAWRSPEAELVAVTEASSIARETGVNGVLAHASRLKVVDSAAGLVIETCPQYLTMLETEVLVEGPFRKFTPPARAHDQRDLDSMWRALATGQIQYVASDHAPSTRAQKQLGSIWDVHFGLPGVDTTLSVLLDGAAAGKIPYQLVAHSYSEAPARIYGLRGKGRIAKGADADVVLVDPKHSWTVADDDVLSKAGWTPYAGRTLRGRAVRTYLRGQVAASDGEVIAQAGWGRYLAGPGAA